MKNKKKLNPFLRIFVLVLALLFIAHPSISIINSPILIENSCMGACLYSTRRNCAFTLYTISFGLKPKGIYLWKKRRYNFVNEHKIMLVDDEPDILDLLDPLNIVKSQTLVQLVRFPYHFSLPYIHLYLSSTNW